MRKLLGRQGDLIFWQVDKIPAKAKKAKDLTLALGEATGHHHTIYKLDEADIQRWALNNLSYVKIEKGRGVVKHQTHKPYELEPGLIEVTRELHYDYFTETIQEVRD